MTEAHQVPELHLPAARTNERILDLIETIAIEEYGPRSPKRFGTAYVHIYTPKQSPFEMLKSIGDAVFVGWFFKLVAKPNSERPRKLVQAAQFQVKSDIGGGQIVSSTGKHLAAQYKILGIMAERLHADGAMDAAQYSAIMNQLTAHAERD